MAYKVAATTTLPVDAVPVAVTDLDGDGRDDVLVGTREQTVVVLRMEADGWVSADPMPFPDVSSVAMFDVDLDGHLDLVVSSPDGIHHMLADR